MTIDDFFFLIKPCPCSLYLLDVLSWAKDGPTKRCALVGCGVKVIKDYLLKVSLHFLKQKYPRH